MEQLKKKLFSVFSFAFVAALAAGVATANVTAEAQNTLEGFALTATAVRLSDTVVDGRNTSGLRFKTETPAGKDGYLEAYTTLTVEGIEGVKTVDAGVWRQDSLGWNTVLMDIDPAFYTANVTAQSFVRVSETQVYETTAVTTSIAQTASWVLNYGDTSERLYEYTANAVEKISLNKKSAVAYEVGETIQLTATTQPAGYGVVWASSNEEVATVDKDGKVTTLGKGTAQITATMSGVTATCNVTVYEKYEIDSVSEFMAMPTGDEYAYCVLTDDIDFNGTLIQYGATPSGNVYAPIGTSNSKFVGVLDGAGHNIYNVTVTGSTNGIYASVFLYVEGTIKNLAVDMRMQAGTINAKDSAFICNLYGGSLVENCYVRFSSHCTQYAINNSRAVAALASVINAEASLVTIANCIAVMDLSGGVTHPTNPFGGAATLVGGLTKDNCTVNVENCYGVMLTAEGDTVHTAKIDSVNTSQGVGVVNKETSSAYTNMADMFEVAKLSISPVNGWSNVWSVDKEAGILKFGSKYIYPAPQLNVAKTDLFLAGANEDTTGVAQSLQLNMIATDGAVSYVSSDATVAMVDANGLVTPKKAGVATITATAGGVEYTCSITVYNYYSLSSAEDFKTKMMSDTARTSQMSQYDYYQMKNNVNFEGIIVNHTEGYRTIGWDGTGSGAPAANYMEFHGIFDGNGYTMQNLVVAPNSGNMNSGLGYASFFGYVRDAVIKNVAVEMTANVGGVNAARGAAFIGFAYDGTLISNCYVNLNCAYYSSGNHPVAPIVSYASPTAVGKTLVIENCVGILQDTTYDRTNGGYAAGLIGRINRGGGGTLPIEINNCYAVEIAYSGRGATEPAVYSPSWNAPSAMTNSFAFGTVTEMFANAATGITAKNGWASFWTVDANALQFGETVIYAAKS